MYTPTAFIVDDTAEIYEMMRQSRLANFITATPTGPMATPLPLFLDESEGERGVLYGHLARPNPQWRAEVVGHGLAVFMGPDAYVTPSWYASKSEHGKVVPTWNYTAVHAFGPVEFFEDADRLLNVVKRLTEIHEGTRQTPWAVTDAPESYIEAQLRGIVGIRMPIASLKGKRKMSQNRPEPDRIGVKRGLGESSRETDRIASAMIPT
ncbi:FMN-binding negative transcriptional regulator [Pararhizobium sp. YC-54]|uniref:FMN-binding negative transcriptional regulator n=1 Tax=Pararhizobium sp. YC-54 TaxID=2986920 RepID=UPI0021F77680|nr:FMN-binding negative transcriptional regulator [Pararhizobium sp. YC-54]MCW0001782.1 FMN-binding negative transcriptional regulator [Pararhizobium sp. YC-54]